MTKFFVDKDGNYLGGFDGAEPPADSVEVPVPPVSALDKWVNDVWVPAPPALDLLRFNQLMADAVTDGIFTDAQFLKAQRLQLVLNEDKRNGEIAELIRDAEPDQQKKFLEIATVCGVPLPQV